MTKGEVFLTDSCLLGPIMLLSNQYFNCLWPEYYITWLCLVSLWTFLPSYNTSYCFLIAWSFIISTIWSHTAVKCVCISAIIFKSTCFGWVSHHNPIRQSVRKPLKSVSQENDTNSYSMYFASDFIGYEFYSLQPPLRSAIWTLTIFD